MRAHLRRCAPSRRRWSGSTQHPATTPNEPVLVRALAPLAVIPAGDLRLSRTPEANLMAFIDPLMSTSAVISQESFLTRTAFIVTNQREVAAAIQGLA